MTVCQTGGEALGFCLFIEGGCSQKGCSLSYNRIFIQEESEIAQKEAYEKKILELSCLSHCKVI